MAAGSRTVQLVIKRMFDVIGAAVALVLLAPLLAVIALAIWITMGRPILFRQVRPGLHGRLFTLYKFRTMRNAFRPDGTPLPDAERLTPLGRFLRRFSLDELPELWNVLRGDMSLIGPRPLLVEYLPRYTPEQARRHNLRPGITGLAQVMGRNALKFSERLAYDVYYVDHFSLLLDLKILALTLWKVPTGMLFDGAGQDVRLVDDLGLHPGREDLTWKLSAGLAIGETPAAVSTDQKSIVSMEMASQSQGTHHSQDRRAA
ncbi:sugar transferase [Thermogutta sp.]|uniref:sugar transferase n=1 Tax=Thermogutta sp. TaxID=1962930 RepID=UPI003C7C7872